MEDIRTNERFEVYVNEFKNNSWIKDTKNKLLNDCSLYEINLINKNFPYILSIGKGAAHEDICFTFLNKNDRSDFYIADLPYNGKNDMLIEIYNGFFKSHNQFVEQTVMMNSKSVFHQIEINYNQNNYKITKNLLEDENLQKSMEKSLTEKGIVPRKDLVDELITAEIERQYYERKENSDNEIEIEERSR